MTQTSQQSVQNNGLLSEAKFARMMEQMLKNVARNAEGDDRKDITAEIKESSETRHIVLPKGMDKLAASEELRNIWEQEEQVIRNYVKFDGWNWHDVLASVKRVTEREFGWMNAQNGFFGSPPTEIDIVTDIVNGVQKTEKAYYGNFEITYWENADASIDIDDYGNAVMNIMAKRKYAGQITDYFDMIRENLRTASIYKGRSIVVSGNKKRLSFAIVENKVSDRIVLNSDTENVIQDFIINDLDEPGKHTYLLTGGYGNAKTETAMRIGKAATDIHNMTFFYVQDGQLFDKVLETSKNYQPAVIFMEDIDEIASGDQRNGTINKVLNTLDGLETKGNNLTTIFTTNHIDRINPALRRPGRIDLVVRFENPNTDSQEKILKLYFDKITGSDKLNYEEIIANLPNASGAVIAEIAKRATKLANKKGGITNQLVLSAISSIKFQVELMEKKVETISEKQLFVDLFMKAAMNELSDEPFNGETEEKE